MELKLESLAKFLFSHLKTNTLLRLENMALRHQIAVLKLQPSGRHRLQNIGRIF